MERNIETEIHVRGMTVAFSADEVSLLQGIRSKILNREYNFTDKQLKLLMDVTDLSTIFPSQGKTIKPRAKKTPSKVKPQPKKGT